jgi:hypothetical protein
LAICNGLQFLKNFEQEFCLSDTLAEVELSKTLMGLTLKKGENLKNQRTASCDPAGI